MFKKFLILGLFLPLCATAVEQVQPNPSLNPLSKKAVFGLDFSDPTINIEELNEAALVGQIPTVYAPKMESLADAVEKAHIFGGSYGVVVQHAAETRVYPLRYLNWHYGVHDEIGGDRIFVMWDPLSAYGTAWLLPRDVEFGVSGLVYRSQTLFYDTESRGLWLPLAGEAITGHFAGAKAETVHAYVAKVSDVLSTDAKALVMTEETGYQRPYDTSPYYDYARNKELLFPVDYDQTKGLARKEMMLAIDLQGKHDELKVAIPVSEVIKAMDAREAKGAKKEITLSLMRSRAGNYKPVDVVIAEDTRGDYQIYTDTDMDVRKTVSYWFAWSSLQDHTRHSTLVLRTLPFAKN